MTAVQEPRGLESWRPQPQLPRHPLLAQQWHDQHGKDTRARLRCTPFGIGDTGPRGATGALCGKQRGREADARVTLLAAQLATLTGAPSPAPPAVVSPSSYVIGRALTSIPSVTCAAKEDYDTYIRDFQGKIGPQGQAIPPAFRANELFSQARGSRQELVQVPYNQHH